MPIKSKNILVVGGAGYIGSHMVLALQAAGYQPIVLDNLSKGHKDAVIGAELIVGDMNDKNLLMHIVDKHQIEAVMHFAAFIEVGESVKSPGKYYQNNVAATLNLLEVMREKHIKKIIFSSTAAVYGEPQYAPIDEQHPLNAINPYGSSKWMVERMLHDYAKSDGLQFAILRYFNAAGADPLGRVGECHEPESHLIPLILQVAAGKRDAITVYGEDYPTPDGTCIRDYIHVADLCEAHLLALEALHEQDVRRSALYARNPARLDTMSEATTLDSADKPRNDGGNIYNLGNGQGYSIREVIESARRVTGHAIPVVMGGRRAGDPAVLVANADKAISGLKWKPKYADLDTIVQHAWRFYCKSKTGMDVGWVSA